MKNKKKNLVNLKDYKKLTKTSLNTPMNRIHEIRVEEIHDHEEGRHFYRVYIEMNEEIRIIGESSTRPQLVRYVSEVY